jgi:hypothetical protein
MTGDDMEEWRVISDFPSYSVSSLGQVKRIKTDARGHRVTGIPLKPSPSTSGYLFVSLCDGKGRKSVRINRLVCRAFHGEPPTSKHHAAHNNGHNHDNNKDNLRWATGVENEADKRIHGTARIGDRHWSKSMPERRSKGERHGRAKLTDADIPKIRADTRFQRAIAKSYGVSQRAIWMIKTGKTWRHVR